MVDVTEDFLVKAKTYLGEEGKRVRNYFCCGLQDFSPEPDSYDVIWIQWVIGEHPTSRPPRPRLVPLWGEGALQPPHSLHLEGAFPMACFNSVPTVAQGGRFLF